MPGTIQVSILEFKALPSSSNGHSSLSLKISMGKRHYQTWDKGDFTFPLTALHDNITVALLDNEGNEIAYTGVQTMLIVEKESLDEIFSFEGGGYVHMKFHFMLSEEERSRIRFMRELAIKKKQVSDPKIGLVDSETASSAPSSLESSTRQKLHASVLRTKSIRKVASFEDVASQTGFQVYPAATFCSDSESSNPKKEGTRRRAIPNPTDQSESVSSSPVIQSGLQNPEHRKELIGELKLHLELAHSHAKPVFGRKTESEWRSLVSDIPQKETPGTWKIQQTTVHNPENHVPLRGSSSNVRKMIRAFNNSLVQNVESSKRELRVKSRPNLFRAGDPFKDRNWKSIAQVPCESPGKIEDNSFSKHRHQTPVGVNKSTVISGNEGVLDIRSSQTGKQLKLSARQVLEKRKELMNVKDFTGAESGVNITRLPSSKIETVTSIMHEKSSRRFQGSSLAPEELDPSNSLFAEGRRGEIGSNSLPNSKIELASSGNMKSLEYYEEEYCSFQSSAIWIFPDNGGHLCITTAGDKVTNLIGCHHAEAKNHQERLFHSPQNPDESNLPFGKESEMNKDEKRFAVRGDSGSGSSSNNESWGLIGQMIKVAVVVGFGAFVLLNREKEPRKKINRQEERILFEIPDYLDELQLSKE